MPNDRVHTHFPLTLGLLAVLAAPVRAQEPLSAIDWLSKSVATPAAMSRPVPPRPDEPPVTKNGALPESVAVTPLGKPSADGVGLLPPAVTGLPHRLWGMGQTAEVAAALGSTDPGSLPALRGLLLTLLLAEAEPPADSGSDGRLLIARVDRLLQMGALDQADALLDAAGAPGPELFRRAFDVALLTGNEDRACQTLRSRPNLSPTPQARIFCLARSGDWNAAALTLRTGVALGQLSAEDEALIGRFLDPDLFEGEPAPPAPSPVTPLAWRMFEAIGEPLTTTTLPLAFAHAELGPNAGWKAQIEAAERLERAGVIAPNLLLGLYTERKPAASGGVWDRAAAFQDFDAAMSTEDIRGIEQTLPIIWDRMTEAELEVPFAMLYGGALSKLSPGGDADRIAFAVELLSPVSEQVAARPRSDPREAFLAGVARGDIRGLAAPDGMSRAIAPAFLNPDPGADLSALVDQDRLGEAILAAIGRISTALHGDQRGVAQGLSLLRKVGLERVARQAALELMLLERRG
ncbi:MAG: hypothetical protein QM656_09530 [Paracoccaceae bacterium]